MTPITMQELLERLRFHNYESGCPPVEITPTLATVVQHLAKAMLDVVNDRLQMLAETKADK